jgi:hypothetical protein
MIDNIVDESDFNYNLEDAEKEIEQDDDSWFDSWYEMNMD